MSIVGAVVRTFHARWFVADFLDQTRQGSAINQRWLRLRGGGALQIDLVIVHVDSPSFKIYHSTSWPTRIINNFTQIYQSSHVIPDNQPNVPRFTIVSS